MNEGPRPPRRLTDQEIRNLVAEYVSFGFRIEATDRDGSVVNRTDFDAADLVDDSTAPQQERRDG